MDLFLTTFSEYGLIGLFLVSFLAATILPISSEPVLALMIANGKSLPSCLLVASVGNTLGGYTNYFLGRAGKLEWIERFFKIDREKVASYQKRISKNGGWLGLFTWAPFVGDPLAVALGYFSANIYLTFTCIAVGKFLRYLVIGLTTYKLTVN